MALFGRKKSAGQKKSQTGKRSEVASKVGLQRNLSSVLIRPRITEKSAALSDQNVYTFVIRHDATKYDVRDAVKQFFNVTPRKVTIVNRPPRRSHSRARNRTLTVPGMKKANVFLKKGERIDLV